MIKYQFVIPNNLRNQRIDKALSSLAEDISRSTIQKAINAGTVFLNNIIVKDANIRIKEDDIIDLTVTEEVPQNIEKTEVKFDIVYEDEELMVINKPAGLTTHPGAGNYDNTLVNGLLYYTNALSTLGGNVRPGIVHRLDKDTSGLMVVAKNNIVHEKLSKKIQDRTLTRKYKALVWGLPNPAFGEIDLNISRSNLDRKRMAVTASGGKHAVTTYKTDQIFLGGKVSLLTCILKTGRTHQIRVHLSHIGHSIVGDQTYGHNARKILGLPAEIQEAFSLFKRQALCSYYLSFNHPLSDRFLEFEIELPTDIKRLIDILQKPQSPAKFASHS